MKEQAKPGVIAIAVILLLVVMGFLGWRTFGPKGETISQASVDNHWQSKQSGPNR